MAECGFSLFLLQMYIGSKYQLLASLIPNNCIILGLIKPYLSTHHSSYLEKTCYATACISGGVTCFICVSLYHCQWHCELTRDLPALPQVSKHRAKCLCCKFLLSGSDPACSRGEQVPSRLGTIQRRKSPSCLMQVRNSAVIAERLMCVLIFSVSNPLSERLG